MAAGLEQPNSPDAAQLLAAARWTAQKKQL
jgi:hypothetical protein